MITGGGPGSGKTTLVSHLFNRGYQVVRESGRAILQTQSSKEIAPLVFAEQMLSRDLSSYKTSQQNTVVLFDRGIPDIIGYLLSVGEKVPNHITQAAREYLYNQVVFIAPFWPEIYKQDSERRQNLKQAQETYEIMREVYIQLGYSIIQLPKASENERAEFIKSYIE